MVPLKANVEKEGKELAARYRVAGLPAIFFIDSNGDVFGRIDGYLPPAEFADEMKRIVTIFNDVPKIEQTLKDKPDDGEANARFAILQAFRGKTFQAEAAIAKAEKAKYNGDAMARAYNAVADIYQSENKLGKAIDTFKRADAVAKTPSDRAYAKISMAVCYEGKDDLTSAKKMAKEVVEMKDAPPQYVEYAKELLED